MNRITTGPVALLIIVSISGNLFCDGPPNRPRTETTAPANEQAKMNDQPDDSEFLTVELNSEEQVACSPPEPHPTWRGIVIRAPKTVYFDREKRIGNKNSFAAIPICAYALLLNTRELSMHPFTFVVEDKESDRVYVGALLDEADGHEDPVPIEEPEPEYGTVAIGGFFNPNLADYVKLPETPGVYEVHIKRGDVVSNKVTIRILEKQAD